MPHSDAARMMQPSCPTNEVINDNVKTQSCPDYEVINDNVYVKMKSYPTYATIEDCMAADSFKVDNPLYVTTNLRK